MMKLICRQGCGTTNSSDDIRLQQQQQQVLDHRQQQPQNQRRRQRSQQQQQQQQLLLILIILIILIFCNISNLTTPGNSVSSVIAFTIPIRISTKTATAIKKRIHFDNLWLLRHDEQQIIYYSKSFFGLVVQSSNNPSGYYYEKDPIGNITTTEYRSISTTVVNTNEGTIIDTTSTKSNTPSSSSSLSTAKFKALSLLSRPERKALERAKKQQLNKPPRASATIQRTKTAKTPTPTLSSIHNNNNQNLELNTNGISNNNNNNNAHNKRRKHNYKDRQDFLEDDNDAIIDDETDINNRVESYRRKYYYGLHSSVVRELYVETTTADELMRAIKRAQNLHDVHDLRTITQFVINETNSIIASYGYRGSLLARIAVAALHLHQHDIAHDALRIRRIDHSNSRIPLESAAIIRGLLRVHNVTMALNVLDDELSIPDKDEFLSILRSVSTTADDADAKNETDIVRILELKDTLKHRTLALASIATRHFYEDEPIMAIQACEQLAQLGPIVREAFPIAAVAGTTTSSNNDDTDNTNNNNNNNNSIGMPWIRLLQSAAQCQSRIRDGSVLTVQYRNKLPCNLVYTVLNVMATFPSNNDDRIYEIVANALVRRVLFVAGAINAGGLPDMDRGEAVFIGRSNVGKSSLINMITNRKSLAYTSKRPGKTQQFNYFAVNDKVNREKEIKYGDVVLGTKDNDSFYIVDVPGYGYAKVPDQQRSAWIELLHNYLCYRLSLKVIFHLIDSRIGPTDDDAAMMNAIGTYLPTNRVSYVIVLTKADKNIKKVVMSSASTTTRNTAISQQQLMQRRGKVSQNVMTKLRTVMQSNGVGNTPIILTSSETKLGRDDLWRYLKLAAEGY